MKEIIKKILLLILLLIGFPIIVLVCGVYAWSSWFTDFIYDD